MKKILLLMIVVVMNACGAFAQTGYVCVEPYDLNNKFMSALSTISGVNFASEIVAQNIMKKEFAKIGKGEDLKYHIDSYSSKDLKNGIFKSMSLTGKNANIDGIYLSSFDIHTLCSFNYVKQNGKNINFVEDLPLDLSLSMSASDINNTMKSDRYKKVIEDVNRLGFGGIKISSTAVEIKSNKFFYTIGISIPFVKVEKKISIGADLKVKNGKIDFENTRLMSNSFNLDLKKIDFIVNYLNPLDFSVKILDNKNAKVSIKNIEISDNIISTNALAVIPKD
ncbi:hypothetical protein IJ579_05675 [bacterium]|nr:hypothetical protein [bacterium]